MNDTEAAENERDRENDRIQEIIDSHVTQIMEHVDSVQIIATKAYRETSSTANVSRGDGDWYARFGACREWIVRMEEESRISVRGDE